MLLILADMALNVERFELAELRVEEEVGFVEVAEEETVEEGVSLPKALLSEELPKLANALDGGGMGLGNFASTFARVARNEYIGSMMYVHDQR